MLHSDHDIFQTFEGDNTVLMQQVGVCVAGGGGQGEKRREGNTLLKQSSLSPQHAPCSRVHHHILPPPPQVSALLLKEYRNQFKGAPLTSSYRFLAQVRGGGLGCGCLHRDIVRLPSPPYSCTYNLALPPEAAHLLPRRLMISSFHFPLAPPRLLLPLLLPHSAGRHLPAQQPPHHLRYGCQVRAKVWEASLHRWGPAEQRPRNYGQDEVDDEGQ